MSYMDNLRNKTEEATKALLSSKKGSKERKKAMSDLDDYLSIMRKIDQKIIDDLRLEKGLKPRSALHY